MKLRTPAKINLSLSLLGKRTDGYHLLDSLVGFIDFYDTVQLTPAPQSRLEIIGTPPTEDPEDNLVMRALRALQRHGVGEYVIRLQKQIFVGAGLGGGSANTAGILRLLGNHLPQETVYQLATRLGADVLMCLHSRPLRAMGIGEETAFLPDYAARFLVLLAPNRSLSTAEVFAKTTMPAQRRVAHPDNPESWHNDLEPAACALCPELRPMLAAVRALPQRLMAGMTGSGSCLFALLPNRETQQQALVTLQTQFPHARTKAAMLLGAADA